MVFCNMYCIVIGINIFNRVWWCSTVNDDELWIQLYYKYINGYFKDIKNKLTFTFTIFWMITIILDG